MKILVIGHHCCMRMQKQAIALVNKGHEVHILGNRLPGTLTKYATVSHYASAEQLEMQCKRYSDVDIVHVHNEPNWMLLVAKKALPCKPVVLDIHDSMMIRTVDPYKQRTEERICYEVADGMVHVNEVCRDLIIPDFPKPNAVLASYVNKEHMQFHSWERMGGIVYEGLISTSKAPDAMQYGNYVNTAKAFRDKGIQFHIHTPKRDSKEVKEEYDNICEMENPLSFSDLIKTLGCYDWGLCGNIDYHREWEYAMPNKLFEYMAGGIPIIALNCEAVGQFVEEHGVGISVSSVEEIKERWDERAECQKNVFMKRDSFAMENHIHKIEELYDNLLVRSCERLLQEASENFETVSS